MSKICAITGKRPVTGGRIIHKGVSKKAGGIGLQLVKNNKRFSSQLQRVRLNFFRSDKANMGIRESYKSGENPKGLVSLTIFTRAYCGT